MYKRTSHAHAAKIAGHDAPDRGGREIARIKRAPPGETFCSMIATLRSGRLVSS